MLINLKCPKCNEPIELMIGDDELQGFLDKSKEQQKMNTVVVIPTWKCGLECPYCEYHQQPDNKSIIYTDVPYHVDKELSPEEWIKLLASFAPATYTFSGGEPLRYDGIVQVLNSLSSWSITSNTLHFTKDIDLSKCTTWTASFHPHITGTARKTFFENIKYIKDQHVPIGVTIVAQLGTVDAVLGYADEIHKLGYNVHLHPYYDNKNFSWHEHPVEAQKLLASPYLMYGENLFEYKGLEGDGICKGGRHYFAIGPDGKVFRCLTDLLLGRYETKIMVDVPDRCDMTCNDKCMFPCDWYFGQRKNNKCDA
jgi:pyruvate-formate lyase-activating enzyme